MGDVPMPGGWTLSMAWIRMCGQDWPAAAASFVAMWVPMMAAMMLPSLAPALWQQRRLGLVAAGYLTVWGLAGLVLFPLGAAFAAAALASASLAHRVPALAAVVVLAAGALQFTHWKARGLAQLGEAARACNRPADRRAAWRHGWRLGLHCAHSSAGPMAALLAVGVMDPRLMAAVTVAVAAERLLPEGRRIVGVVALVAGLQLLLRAGA